MSRWLDLSNNANLLKQTYVRGFVDISGGGITTRGTADKLVIGGDTSLNGTGYLGNQVFVKSDGLVTPGTATNGAVPYYGPDTPGTSSNGAYAKQIDVSYNSNWTQVGSNVGASMRNVAINGDGTIVAAGGTDGVTRVYKWNGSSWNLMGAAIGREYSGSDSASVSLSNDGLTVAIGLPYNDGTNTSLAEIGHVRIYQYRTVSQIEWDNTLNRTSLVYNNTFKLPIIITGGDTTLNTSKSYWVQVGADIDGEYIYIYPNSGGSINLNADGTIVAIGARYGDRTGVSNCGEIRVYQYRTIASQTEWNTLYNTTSVNQSTYPIIITGGYGYVSGKKYWVQMGLDIEGGNAGDYFGDKTQISADGYTVAGLATGAPGDSLYARVYNYRTVSESSWTNYNKTNFTYTGVPIVVGAANDPTPVPGKYYWVQKGGQLTRPASDNYLYSVGLSGDGNTLALGTKGVVGSINAGFVYVYKWNNTSWAQLGDRLRGPETNPNGIFFGINIDINYSGDIVAAHCNGDITNRIGPTRIFQYRTYTNDDVGRYTTTVSSNATPVLIGTSPSVGNKYWMQLGFDSGSLLGGSVNSAGESLAISKFTGTTIASAVPNSGMFQVFSIPATITYYDICGGIAGYYPIKTTAALCVSGATDISGNSSLRGNVSIGTSTTSANLFVSGDCSINGNLRVNRYSANSINLNSIFSTADVSFANRLFVARPDISLNYSRLRVAPDLSSANTTTALGARLTVPANITIVDGSNGTVYGSYLSLTNKNASNFYNVGKSASGIFNIVNQNNAGVYITSGGTSFTGTSDARLKTNIVPLSTATEKIMALKPCTYQWKADVESASDPTAVNTHIGFIAQEVEEVMPELVHPINHPAGPDYKSVNTTDMIPYLVRMIQENRVKIDALRKDIETYI